MQNFFSSLQQKINKSDKKEDNQVLLAKQQETMNKINSLLESSASAISCGPSCQKLKITDELKQKYLDAQTNIKTAPIKLEETKKNYYVYTEGRPFYDNMLEDDLKMKSDKMSVLLSENFESEVSNAETMNTYYNTALINSGYTKQLLVELSKKNKIMRDRLRLTHSDILTNDRKTYYETEALNNLKEWYNIWWYIYYILVITFGLSLILLNAYDLSIIKRVLILVLLIVYPYIINPIL